MIVGFFINITVADSLWIQTGIKEVNTYNDITCFKFPYSKQLQLRIKRGGVALWKIYCNWKTAF